MKQKKMDPRVKKLWVDALRSGEYKQGDSTLRTKGDKFCCLGVLCDINAQEAEGGWREVGLGWVFFDENGVEGECYPPKGIEEWSGFSYFDRGISIGRDVLNLASHNDVGRTFEQIADAIEEQL